MKLSPQNDSNLRTWINSHSELGALDKISYYNYFKLAKIATLLYDSRIKEIASEPM